MDKVSRAKLLLIELESLSAPNDSPTDAFNLLNEVLRDAKILAEEVAAEEKGVA